MDNSFKANALPVLIGSLPMDDHDKALDLVLENTPEIPLWVQLPGFKKEGMITQFVSGLPGLVFKNEKIFIDSSGSNYDKDFLEFYEDYLSVAQGDAEINDSRFVIEEDSARGFYVFMDRLKTLPEPPIAVKGQITGPFTFCTGLNDNNGRSIFYDEQARVAAVKLIALKAGWQVKQLSKFGRPVIIFLDEPALAGFGSSAFLGISREEISTCLEEVINAVHAEGGIAGIHVCANSDWSLILESSARIVSFDAYSYFDKFILYSDEIKNFIDSGRIIAWGIVPTSQAEDIDRATTASLVSLWEERVRKVGEIGISKTAIIKQSFITPSCGTGSLSLDHAVKVLNLTREVSAQIRKNI